MMSRFYWHKLSIRIGVGLHENTDLKGYDRREEYLGSLYTATQLLSLK
jgi:hypothetical protein